MSKKKKRFIIKGDFRSLAMYSSTVLFFLLLLFLIPQYNKYNSGIDHRTSGLSTEDNIKLYVFDKHFELDNEQLLADSPAQNSKVGFFKDFFVWTGIFLNEDNLSHLDLDYIRSNITLIEEGLKIDKVSEGSVFIENGQVQIEEPQKGLRIDQDQLLRDINKKIHDKENPNEIQLKVIEEIPKTDLDSLKEIAEVYSDTIERELILKTADGNIEKKIIPEEIAELLSVEFTYEKLVHEIVIDEVVFGEIFSQYLNPALDASFDTSNSADVKVIPSLTGTGIESDKTIKSILKAVKNENTAATLFMSDVLFPEFTTKDAEALQIKHLVSSFTTYHPCCQSRTDNIQHFADIVDGATLAPGEELNLNTLVGQRTEENGFKPAGTLVKGVLINTVGGGVSQFATTFFNAIYWGGYEDVSHSPHSRYFSRYPEGVEATISWPKPDLIFRNDYKTGLLIRTKHSSQSITVEFYGDNSGRTIVGKHTATYGSEIRTTNPGDENSRVVESTVSDPYNERAAKIMYHEKRSLPEGGIEIKDVGRKGYSIKVNRMVSKGEDVVHNDEFNNYYLSENSIILVPSCETINARITCVTEEDKEKEQEELLEFYEILENGQILQ
jgi:vancomycin resistance protein YoaR